MNLKHLMLAVGVVFSTTSHSWADMPPRELIGVRIHLSTDVVVLPVQGSTVIRRGQIMSAGARMGQFQVKLPGTILDGYLMREKSAPQLSTSTIYKIADVLPESRFQFWSESELQEVKFPWPMIIHPSRHRAQLIEASIVTKVERQPARLDGTIIGLDNFLYVSPELAKLLASGPPVYSCRVYSGEMSDEQLVSYNAEINQDRMAALCKKGAPGSNTRERLTDEEIDEFLKHGNTFVIGIPVD